ncbi:MULTISPECIES: formimidoylglutamase [unclassified Peribacillus]|uniref:formimidoylglutamase n=1 Tax=unclassified Peribacillus TaxID=2675266 RepID=UPI001914D689|nr:MULTISPECIES: formimidoylglutamase [unclassified Peribacillus]MBK5446156.1 formimidoylglutamase [Peribacillus sp. TH24]MBK5502539.1 formimidoylglutamase [Peribacillus sp. TH14]WMX57542.1 formimidoylglutamase [Peribacillus sp. R9-11]
MYEVPNMDLWKGRTDSLIDKDEFRIHQIVSDHSRTSTNDSCGIIGFSCDEGVRRNKGRLGSKEAPNEIRKSLSSLSWHGQSTDSLVDFGNIICENQQLEAAQAELGSHVEKILTKNMFPVILGGGHETFYGHYLGVRSHVGPNVKIGILNIDAHFDLRSYDQMTSSGTMFKQILDNDSQASYLPIGIQRYGNTKKLFNTATSLNCSWIYEEELVNEISNENEEKIQNFINQNDCIILTLCMDVINASEAPGVSAPSSFGLSGKIVRELIRKITSHKKTISFDICEVNPSLDYDNRTVKLAANLINEVFMCVDKK